MHIVYIDESGSYNDSSYKKQNNWQPSGKRESKYFVLTGLVVNELKWKNLFKKVKNIRENIKKTHKIPLKEYIHTTELITGSGIWRHEKRKDFSKAKRIKLLKNLLHEYSQLNKYCYYASVFADKTKKFCNPVSCRELAYENLINRLEKDIDDNYIIIHDGQEDGFIIRLLRKKRIFNFIQGKKFTLSNLTEDPLFKHAKNSYFLQIVDHIAYTILHYYDDHLPNDNIGKLYNASGLKNLGNPKVCYKTKIDTPGHIPVPSN